MPTVSEYFPEVRYQLSSSISVDKALGVIPGATVAQAGVRAQGKFLCLDKNGAVTYDPEQIVTKLPVYTDEKTLETLLAAAESAGGRLKVRSDHNEDLSDRAGYADNFRRVENRVVADIHLFSNYRDREIVLETAEKTPSLIGLSIDFMPSFVVLDNQAWMRVDSLNAVDIVDAGAITPKGMFFKVTLDKTPKVETENLISSKNSTLSKMADDKKAPTIDDCMSAIGELSKSVAALAAAVTPKPAADAPKETNKAESDSEVLAAVKAQGEQLRAVNEKLANIEKEKAALGLSGKSASAGTSPDSASESERARLASEKQQANKTFMDLVADAKKENSKMRGSEVVKMVMTANPKKYAEHLAAKGVVKAA